MMNGNILTTLLYVVSLIISVSAFFLWRKSSTERNGFIWLILSYYTVQLFGGVAAGIMTLVHIPVTIVSLGLLYLAFGIATWVLMYKEAKRMGRNLSSVFQKYTIEKYDVILFVFVTLVIGALMNRAFGTGIAYPYSNTDAGLHLREATTIVRNKAVNGMFFNHLENALIIEALEPFFAVVEWYKAYVLADAFHVWLEALTFAALIRKFLTGNVSKVFGLVVFVLYFMGYPFFCYYYAFEYWGMGTLLIAYLILVIREFEEAKVDRKISILMLMAGCYGVVLSYMLFAPFVYIFVFAYLFVIAKRENVSFKKAFLTQIKVFALPCIIGFYYCYFDFFVKQGDSVTGSINNGGGTYTELYIDFALMFIPVIFFFVHHIKERKITVEFCMTAFWLVVVVAMLALVLADKVSPYYYYKMYYPLWMLMWMATMEVLAYWREYMVEALVSYAILYGGLLVMCFGNIEYKILTSDSKVTTGYHSAALFTLYSWNKSYLQVVHSEQDPAKMELYNWIIENLGDEDIIIPIMTETNDYGEAYLYEGIVGWDCGHYYGWRYSDEEVWETIENEGVSYITVLKMSQYFDEHEAEIYDMNIVYENDAGYVIAVQ